MTTGWDKFTVGELVDQGILEKPLDGNHGELHPTIDDYVERGIPFVMATDVIDGKLDLEHCAFISFERSKVLRKGFAKEGDVLLTHKATIGRTAIIPKLDTDYIVLTPQVTYYRVKDEDRLSSHYLKYFFDSPLFQGSISQYASVGATRAYIGITEQLQLKVTLPHINIQRRIAEVLRRYDSLIETYQQQIGILEASAQTLYREWFVHGRCPYAEEGRAKTITLSKMADVNLHSILGQDEDAPISYVDISSVGTGRINEVTPYLLKDAPGRAKRLVKHGDIIFSTVRPENRSFALILLPAANLVVSTGFAVISPKKSFYSCYLYCQISSGTFITEVSNKAKGSAYPQVGFDDLMETKITTYPDHVLVKFHKVVNAFFLKMENLQSQIALLRQMRDKLLPRLMSGQIPLTADE